ncbi:glycerol-3-phosphate 1-O-acyltransferase PlsY [Leadbetterella sp. DM7]|uniref:glycerol-3-phosphate 1-O-acyltransferase PlsY n=1 Tax=Leadbetterella sp. DM7 TaxID=3235085 RepID=UPI00349EA496
MMFLEFVLAFLIGSVPTAYWYAKYVHHLDIRQHGSGNIGATNSLRVLGKKAGIIVLFIDMLKGLIPVLIAGKLGFTPENILLTGVFSVLGHLFSPFVGFKGGKGIATGFGVILAFSPWAALISIAVFGIVLYFSRYVSLGSVCGVLAFWVYTCFQAGNSPKMLIIATVLAALLIISHRKNLARLLNGTENRLSGKR